jgi:hypothetical protein
MSVDEGALSIAANGFFPEEHLLAIAQNPNEDVEARNLKEIARSIGDRHPTVLRLYRG